MFYHLHLTFLNLKGIYTKGEKMKIILIFLTSLVLIGCQSTQPQYSQAAQNQRTVTGVSIKSSPVGRALTPSIEYIRVKPQKSIFLDPPEDNNKIYVRIRDTSDREWNIDMQTYVARQLKRNGLEVVKNAKDAAYSLQANILLAQGVSAAEIAQLDETQYGQSVSDIAKSAIGGALVGAGGASLLGGHQDTIAGAAVLGAITGGLLSYQKDAEKAELLKAQQETKFFSVVVDVEIRERIKGGLVTRKARANTADNRNLSGETHSRSETESFTDTSTWKRYRTRINGKAKGKLVVFADVEQEFATKIAKSIGGLF